MLLTGKYTKAMTASPEYPVHPFILLLFVDYISGSQTATSQFLMRLGKKKW
jgi:hypothetical protein